MARKERFYDNKTHRKTIVDEENLLGFRYTHDDFLDNQGNPTNGKSGKLTFTDEPISEVVKTKMTASAFIEELAKIHNVEIVGVVPT
jgi:hypothetical protein